MVGSTKSTKSSKSSKASEKHSWVLSLGRRSGGHVHSPFSLHTRLAHVLAEDRQDAFDPNAKVVKAWYHVLLFCLVLEVFLLPYFLTFHLQSADCTSTLCWLVVACECVFAIDLYVQAYTGYYSGGNLIRDKKLTRRRYVRSAQFVLDIMAIVPCQLLVFWTPSIVPILLLLKLLRCSRLPHFVSSLDEVYAKFYCCAQTPQGSGLHGFMVAMASLLEMIALPAQTTLFSTGDFGDAMYVVHSGVLAIVVKSVTVREIRKGSWFGELSVFSSMPRTASVISTTYVILYKLSRFHCERVLVGYPECAKLIAAHVQDVLSQLNKTESQTGNNDPQVLPKLPKRMTIRRASVAAGVVAGASALGKVLSKRGKGVLSNSRKSLEPWFRRKSTVSPGHQNYSDPKAERDLNEQRVFEFGGAQEELATPISSEKPFLPWNASNTSARKSTLNPYSDLQHQTSTLHNHLLLLPKCIDQHSHIRMWWLLLLLSNLCYSWLMIPVQVAFPLLQRPSWLILAVDTISNAALLVDLVLNFSLSFMIDAEKVMDSKRSAHRYLRQRFLFDLACALLYEYVYMPNYGVLRLPRLMRIYHLRGHLKELAHFISFNSKRQIMLLGVLLFMLFHVVTCIHFGISYLEGFNPNEEEAWISPINVCLQRLNTTHLENCNGTVFVVSSDLSELQAITALEYSRSLGFLITAVVVDNVQKRFTASAFEQKTFFATTTRIQLFLRRQNAPLAIHHRVKSFLDYWWSSHRGAVIGELLADLPRPIRLDLLRSICLPVLQTLALLQGVRQVLDTLQEVMVENAKFILYGQGEVIYRFGDSVVGMFFLLEGNVCVVEKGETSRGIPRGGFFGTAALTQQERGEGYTEHVSAKSGCILLLVSSDQLQAMEVIFPQLKEEALALEQRLLGNKLSSMHMQKQKDLSLKGKSTSRILQSTILVIKELLSTVHDPDSWFILAWETWVFVAMTMQWVLIMLQTCFPVGNLSIFDILMMMLDVSFLVDIQVRSRLGFHEFGNKVMELSRIKREYFRSCTFVLDIVVLLPLYIVNWSLPL
ncbi:unnamed protein product [Phytophthora lilii]|uniref:Unnamed protein product n=1 Tax=Phytophthora lilii TaxID=2077276 RepID=A0A9W7CPZ8_9STRA|nr:unnamed protein product [Phytophthora lilii]